MLRLLYSLRLYLEDFLLCGFLQVIQVHLNLTKHSFQIQSEERLKLEDHQDILLLMHK